MNRILVVANRSVATPALLEAIERRSASDDCEISLLIPDAADGRAGDWTLRHAVRLIERTSGTPVRGVLRRTDPFDAIAEALREDTYDEVVISTLPRARSRWLHRSLPRRVERLGVPVTVVSPEGELVHA